MDMGKDIIDWDYNIHESIPPQVCSQLDWNNTLVTKINQMVAMNDQYCHGISKFPDKVYLEVPRQLESLIEKLPNYNTCTKTLGGRYDIKIITNPSDHITYNGFGIRINNYKDPMEMKNTTPENKDTKLIK
jgi:hypothetical protein